MCIFYIITSLLKHVSPLYIRACILSTVIQLSATKNPYRDIPSSPLGLPVVVCNAAEGIKDPGLLTQYVAPLHK